MRKTTVKPELVEEPVSLEGIRNAISDLASKDQVLKFKLHINKLLAPQDGPQGLYDLDRKITVIKRTGKTDKEGIGKTDRRVTEDITEQTTKNTITLHKFRRNTAGIVQLPLGGPRGLLMTHLYQTMKKIAAMRSLAPHIFALNVLPETVTTHVTDDNLPVSVQLEKVYSGYKEMRRQMAYEYIQDTDGIEMEFHNSSVAPLSNKGWALIFQALNTLPLPPTGRSSVTAEPVI